MPKLCANTAYGKVAVAVGEEIFVFGEGCSALLMQLSFQYAIDAIIWAPGGNFLILADVSGAIHCTHIPSNRNLITK